MVQAEDLTGRKFGRLTVVERAPNAVSPSGSNRVRWLCQCECGNQKIVYGQSLRKGSTKSCGCLSKEMPRKKGHDLIDLTGQKFGRLTVIERAEDYVQSNGVKRVQWYCRCDCGNYITVTRDRLTCGITKSCGCLQKEYQKQRNKNYYEEHDDYYIGYTNKNEPFYFDKDNYEKVTKYCWFTNREGYIVSYCSNKEYVWLHRLCMNVTDPNILVDHKHGKETRNDNRRNNLRVCNHFENGMNIGLRAHNKSGVTGVYWDKSVEKWGVIIMARGVNHHLGYYEDKEDAIKARKKAEDKYFGEWSYDNSRNAIDNNNKKADNDNEKLNAVQ